MGYVDLRLTKTGILQPNGVLDEVTHSNVKFTKNSVYAAEFDETSNIAVPMRFNEAGVLQVSGLFDEVNKPYVPVDGSGGTITTFTSGDTVYSVHSFTSSGSFTLQEATTVDVLLVGGGAGAGPGLRINSFNYYSLTNYGKPGQVLSSTITLNPGTYNVIVGSGGLGSTWSFLQGYGYISSQPTNGTASTFNGLTATGGSGFIPDNTPENTGIVSNITGTNVSYAPAPPTNVATNLAEAWVFGAYGRGSQSGFGNVQESNRTLNTGATPGQNGGDGIVIIRYSNPANK